MAKKKPAAPQIDIPALIDELGAITLELAQAKQLEKRADAIRDILRGEAKKYPAHASVQMDGIRFTLQLGANENQRSVPDLKKMLGALGEESFLRVVKVVLGELDKVCPNAMALGLLTEERTGKRSVNAFVRAAVAA